jgi:hypothetical protein
VNDTTFTRSEAPEVLTATDTENLPEAAGDLTAHQPRGCLTITLTETGPGCHDTATHGDLIATSARHSAARKLARMMLAQGIPDAPLEARSTDGSLRWTYRSLAEFARYDTNEAPRLHRAKWAPNPRWAAKDEDA